MRSEQTRSTLTRHMATAMILMASGLACSTTLAAPTTAAKSQVMTLQGVPLQGRAVESIRIENPQSPSSFGMVTHSNGLETEYLFRNELVVRTQDWDAVASAILAIPGASIDRQLDEDGQTRVISTPSVNAAFDAQRILRDLQGVLAEVDSGAVSNPYYDRFFEATRARREAQYQHHKLQQAPGVTTFGGEVDPQVALSTQWNFVNDGSFNGAWTAHDNRILESIYSTDLLTGAGVNVGIAIPESNQHLDVDHSDLVNPGGRSGGYRADLSQVSDLNLFPDHQYLTGFAGIVAAERGVGPDLQGVAPGSGVGTLQRGPTPLFEYNAFRFKQRDLGIKVHQLIDEYVTPGAAYNETRINEYVTDSFENSYIFGRRGRGTINIFGTGVGFNTLPDPYSPVFGMNPEPWDGVAALGGNAVAVTITNAFLGPGALGMYVGAQTHMYPPANDRNSLVITSVAEDMNIDSLAAIGPGVFASAFAGATNEFWSGSQATSGRGVETIGPMNAPSMILPAALGDIFDPSLGLFSHANTTGATTVAGVVALMLEANPFLGARDIQHIFFQSIQESTRPASITWPHFDPNRVYYFPDAAPTDPAFLGRSFWQANSGFYNNPNATPPVVNQTIKHSDQYGFGVIDAELAIQKAKTWRRLPRLVLLDSGIVGDVNQGDDVGNIDDPRVPVPIADAVFVPTDAMPDITGIPGLTNMIPNTDLQQIRFCIRDNIRIESIVIELTIEGAGSNDLYITLTSPSGTVSTLSYPTTLNLTGQTTDDPNDDELDGSFTSGEVNGTTYAYYQHPFITYKHWGEFSGGSWALDFNDYGPDEENPEGVEAADPPDMTMPGGDMIITLGEIGVPGSTIREPKTVTAFRVKVYGTETNEDIFFGCAPGATSCPGDFDGNGIVDTGDFLLFLTWWQTGDVRADVNQDGSVDFADINAFRAIFTPGPCDTSGGIIGGRPRPSTSNSSDTNPTTRPI